MLWIYTVQGKDVIKEECALYVLYISIGGCGGEGSCEQTNTC